MAEILNERSTYILTKFEDYLKFPCSLTYLHWIAEIMRKALNWFCVELLTLHYRTLRIVLNDLPDIFINILKFKSNKMNVIAI